MEEPLLKLIYNDRLSDDTIGPHMSYINYSRGPGYLTPLMNAIYNKSQSAALVLLKHNADPTIRIVRKKVIHAYT